MLSGSAGWLKCARIIRVGPCWSVGGECNECGNGPLRSRKNINDYGGFCVSEEFNSNFQWSTTSRDVKDGKAEHISREPEQVKAFRDTWRDGVHSYLTYLRDRLTVARDLLTESGSIFVQIGDENVHRVRALMDEVFGEENFVEAVSYRTKNMTLGGRYLEGVCDLLLWYSKKIDSLKYRGLFRQTVAQGDSHWNRVLTQDGQVLELATDQIKNNALIPEHSRLYQLTALYPTGPFDTGVFTFSFHGRTYDPRRVVLGNRRGLACADWTWLDA